MVPPDSVPRATPKAPSHINSVSEPMTSSMTTLVIVERIEMRRSAVAKLASTAVAKRWPSRGSWLKA